MMSETNDFPLLQSLFYTARWGKEAKHCLFYKRQGFCFHVNISFTYSNIYSLALQDLFLKRICDLAQ